MEKTALIAGSTGYLGRFAVRAFKSRGYRVRALTRSEERLGQPGPFAAPAVADCVDEVFVGEVTKPETLEGLMEGVDVVFSSIGISRQRDGLTFEQVDHQANRLLIDLAKQADVEKSSTCRSGGRTRSGIWRSCARTRRWSRHSKPPG